MANPYAGEVALWLDGQRHVARLTLGALAELEAALEAGSLIELVERFEGRRFSSRDVLALIVAGLRGAAGQAVPMICARRKSAAGRSRRRGWRRNCWRGPLPCRARMSGRIDWPGLIRAGLGQLGLAPEVFWRLTPVELRIMLGAEAAAPP